MRPPCALDRSPAPLWALEVAPLRQMQLMCPRRSRSLQQDDAVKSGAPATGVQRLEDGHHRQPADTDDVLYIAICRIQAEQFELFEESSVPVLLAPIRF
jgi:hypothetical protein